MNRRDILFRGKRVDNHELLKEMQRLNSMDIEMTYTLQFDGKTHQLITRSIIKETDND